MSWSFKFFADSKEQIHVGLNRHLGEGHIPISLQTEMLRAVDRALTAGFGLFDGIGWIVESFGHVGDGGGSCNFSFSIVPVNTTRNHFYASRYGEVANPAKSRPPEGGGFDREDGK